MCLVGVRSTSPDAGLVAILVERGGPGMLAVPVGVREGLSLAAGEVGPATSWTGLMSRCAEAAGARLSHVRLDVDDDARLCAAVVLAEGTAPGSVTLEAVREHAERTVPRYALPHRLEVIEEMPRSQIGKILRRVVREGILVSKQ